MRLISVPQLIFIYDRFETRSGFALIGLAVRADVEGGGDRVEQAAARRGHRRIDAASHHRFESRKRSIAQFGVKAELRKTSREVRPIHHGREMGVKIAPGLANSLSAARHRDRPQRAQPLIAAIVGEQKFPAQIVPSSPKPKPSMTTPNTGGASRGRPFSARHAAT